jgi:teichuronic acid exporter
MLKKKAVAAGLWSRLDVGTRFGIQFVSIVLARLLSPTDFGIYALTAVFIALSTVLVDGGFSTALIQRKDVSEEDRHPPDAPHRMQTTGLAKQAVMFDRVTA